MEKRWSELLVLLSGLLLGMVLLVACTTSTPPREMELPTVRGELAKLSAEEGNWLDLTMEEKLADFDYLYQTLAENYPYFGVLERKIGVDLSALYQETRPKIAETTSDAAFYVALDKFVEQAQDIGHLSIITPMDYDWFVQSYQQTDAIPARYQEQMKRLGEVYGNEQSRFTYDALSNITQPIIIQVQKYYEQMDQVTESDNVTLDIIEEGRIAHITVNSFDMAYYAADREKLWAIYEQVADYDHVIFDLTANSGGGMRYFDDLIAAPNITQPLICPTYFLIKDGALNRAFLDLSDYQPISEMPTLSKMNEQDLAELDAFREEVYTITPLADEKMLHGQLWLLVGSHVFSSAEYAAMVSKTTNFATLVGQRTGGDGIGEDPLPIVLPNSGLIVRYSAIYGVSADGTGSQEWGTEPDIYAAKDETALTACLRAINKAWRK